MKTYENELWEEIKQVSVNLYYLDDLRAGKAKLEPYYKGALSFLAISSAICSFIKIDWLPEITAIVTAIVSLAPVLFPILPSSADFAKMDDLRLALKNRLTCLEGYWDKGFTEERYKAYLKSKKAFNQIDTEVTALFGKISTRIEKHAQSCSERYLDRYFTS